jgi:hypothetical protein
MLISGGFVAACLQSIAKGVLDPRLPWAERALLDFDDPVDLVHGLKTVKGLLLLVPPRTPRSSGYDVYAHTSYVTRDLLLFVYVCYICYMLYVYHGDMFYVCYMSSGRGVVRVRLYAI